MLAYHPLCLTLRTVLVAFAAPFLLSPAVDAAVTKKNTPAKVTMPTKANEAPTQGYHFTPLPAWVKPMVAEDPPATAQASIQVLLMDKQTRVGTEGTVRYQHIVRRIGDAAGLQRAGQIEIDFDPSYQRLGFHQLAVWRDGKRIDKLDRKLIKLLHREPQLERQVIDGRMTASVVVDDLRIGDRIEWAFSLAGDNPVFGNRYVDAEWLISSSGPTSLAQMRLLTPTERTIRRKNSEQGVEVEETTKDGWRETLVRRRNVPHHVFDPLLPPAELLKERVEFSEFDGWGEVARWADALFSKAITGKGSIEAIDALARQIEAEATSAEERLRRALDFSQQEVRYFGTEMGIHSHQPAVPEKVLQQRFGDCKDKTALLVALLRRLGLKAEPVLVSNYLREKVGNRLAGPLAFDHAIVRVTLDGQALWLDPTRNHQSGKPLKRQVVGMGFGLVAAEDTTALAAMPPARDILRIETVDHFRFPKLAEEGRFDSVSTLHGDHAEWLRELRSSLPPEELDKHLVAEVTRAYPSLRIDGKPLIENLAEDNAVRLTIRARTGDYWRFPEQKVLLGEFALSSIAAPLRLQDQTPRSQAMRLGMTGRYKHSLRYEFGETIFPQEGGNRHDETTPHFAVAIRYKSEPQAQLLDGELRLTAESLAAGEWTAYRDQLLKTFPRLGNTLRIPVLAPSDFDKLRKEATELEERIERRRLKVLTADQAHAHRQLLWLDSVLAADRLPPKLRAQALRLRGAELDHLGKPGEAESVLLQAQALDAEDSDIQATLAVNALIRRKDADAIRYAGRALELAPNSMPPRYTRAWANFFSGDFAKSRDELSGILQSASEVERSYGSIWLYLTSRRLGEDGLTATQNLLPSSLQPAWPYPVLQLLQGKIDFDKALDAAREDKKRQLGQQCELYFYAAQKALLDRDFAKAKRYFKESLDTGVVEFNEYGMAKRELERMEAQGI